MLYRVFSLLKRSAVAWSADNGAMHGAALAFYSTFSLAPLLLIAIGITSLIIGDSAAHAALNDEIRQTVGPTASDAIISMLDDAHRTGSNTKLTLIGLVTLLVGASGAFVQLQTALNVIWKVQAPSRTRSWVLFFLRNRLFSFIAVLCTGLLMLLLVVVNSILAAVRQGFVSASILGDPTLWEGVSLAVSLCFTSVLFTLVFKLLPDAHVRWRDALKGAILTAVLFTLGQYLIGMYLGQASVASTFGAAGSLVVLLVWVYYSAQIVLFGAEFTHACAESC